jgi:hypothetical protein
MKNARAPVEKWQENLENGFVKCIPCQKIIDHNHLASRLHEQKVWFWLNQRELRDTGYPAPVCPYHAWVPENASNPLGDHFLWCLLCKKRVQDATSHADPQEGAPCSKGHQNNLDYISPGQWEECVVQGRLKYPVSVLRVHPDGLKWHYDCPVEGHGSKDSRIE